MYTPTTMLLDRGIGTWRLEIPLYLRCSLFAREGGTSQGYIHPLPCFCRAEEALYIRFSLSFCNERGVIGVNRVLARPTTHYMENKSRISTFPLHRLPSQEEVGKGTHTRVKGNYLPFRCVMSPFVREGVNTHKHASLDGGLVLDLMIFPGVCVVAFGKEGKGTTNQGYIHPLPCFSRAADALVILFFLIFFAREEACLKCNVC